MTDPVSFVHANTVLSVPSLVPDIRLHLATEILPLWSKTEAEIEKSGLPPPYWAFAWAGGQALARYVLDHPEIVRGRSVLDFGSGSGIVAIAAAKGGAASVLAADIDAFAAAAIRLNATANAVVIDVRQDDVLDGACVWDTVLVGDMCYERPLAERLLEWLTKAARRGTAVLLGDPGRSYFPKSGIEKLARYQVQTLRDLEDRDVRETAVYRLLSRPSPG
ncbi:MAG: class I SAM-dependent methyltransferase [Rhizomicrobium sp.]